MCRSWMIKVNRPNRVFEYLFLVSLQTVFGATAAEAADTTVFLPSTSCSTYLLRSQGHSVSPYARGAKQGHFGNDYHEAVYYGVRFI